MDFSQALTSTSKNAALPEAHDYFGRLIGGWKIDYIDNKTSRVYKGEWYFSRILDGMAIQDVIVLPEYEYGTTVRVYDPKTGAWDISYCYTGKIMLLNAVKRDNMIVLSHVGNPSRKWVFAEIADDAFHWQDVTVGPDGNWRADFDIYAKRI